MATLIAYLIGSLVVLGLMVYNSLIWGWLVHKLYLWFILSQFPNLPHITIVQFIGISLFLNALLPKSSMDTKSKDGETATQFVVALLLPFLTLLFSYIVKEIWFL